jgi:hypothetical protein
MAIVITGADGLVGGRYYSGPDFYVSVGFQNFPVIAFVLFGSVVMFERLVRALRTSWLGLLLVVSATLWLLTAGSTVLQRYPGYWISVRPETAVTLAEARAAIPRGAEVVVSQGISGRFSSRSDVRVIMGLPLEMPAERKAIYFVLSPTAGIQTTSPANTLALTTWLERKGAKVVVRGNDVWVLRLRVQGRSGRLLLPGVGSICELPGASARWSGGCY